MKVTLTTATQVGKRVLVPGEYDLPKDVAERLVRRRLGVVEKAKSSKSKPVETDPHASAE